MLSIPMKYSKGNHFINSTTILNHCPFNEGHENYLKEFKIMGNIRKTGKKRVMDLLRMLMIVLSLY